MAMTLTQYVDSLRWPMAEKGMQHIWNQLRQITLSISGTTITAGTVVLGTADIADGGGTGIEKSAANSIAGPFAATGAQATTSGEKVQPADPGGNVGPHPQRLSQRLPTNGFRPSI